MVTPQKLLRLQRVGFAAIREAVLDDCKGSDDFMAFYESLRDELQRRGLTEDEIATLVRAAVVRLGPEPVIGDRDDWISGDDILWSMLAITEEKLRSSSVMLI